MDLSELHKHSLRNREELQHSKSCGCFSCKSIYPASEIDWWTDDDQTAICPYCDVDAVLGDACGVELTQELLEEMYIKYFEVSEDEIWSEVTDEDWEDEEEEDEDWYDGESVRSACEDDEYEDDQWIERKIEEDNESTDNNVDGK